MTRPEFPVRVLPSGRTSTTTNGRTAPKASHLHLGPIGVAPEAQGQHIGYRLMTQYCEALAESAVLPSSSVGAESLSSNCQDTCSRF